eukprot:EG_transcript_247
MTEARKHAVYEPGVRCFYCDDVDSWRMGTIQAVQGEGSSAIYTVETAGSPAEESRPPAQVPIDRLAPLEEDWLQPVSDLLAMPTLHDCLLLEQIRRRYWEDVVYTNIGPIVLALNPFNFHLPLYAEDRMQLYIAEQQTALYGNSALPTHHWSVAHEAYWRMRTERRPQSILVTGESGAGKTEGAKMVLKYLAKASTFYAPAETKQQASAVTSKIEIACPILEAFGNARTLRNENSSRFGKFMKLQFNQHGCLHGAYTINYLLERSRVVGHAPGERSYHTFYQLLNGASEEERATFGLGDKDRFQWLFKGVPRNERDLERDRQDYSTVRAAFAQVGFAPAEVAGVYTVVAGILHLQGLRFVDQRGKAHLSEEDFDGLQFVAQLWGCNVDVLFAELTTTTTSVRGDTYTVEHTVAQASDIRDALSKALYERTFQYIVDRLNAMLDREPDTAPTAWIGLLDIFGFENFKDNYFEQLCINYCNEQLQQHYNHCIFQRDLAEYAAEGIETTSVEAPNNQPTLDLISGPMGLFPLLDDQARTGSDEKFLATVYDKHARHKAFRKPRIANNTFGVAHYAGDVWYSSKGIRDKNVDPLKPTLRILIRSSTNGFLARLLEAEPEPDAQRGARGPATVSKSFVNGLQQLMDTINTTEPHWIRCVKPHSSNRPRAFCGAEVMGQLQCAGVLETIRIRQSGFAVRLPHRDFWLRFHSLLAAGPLGDVLTDIRRAIGAAGLTDRDAQVGATKVFLKSFAYKALEQCRNAQLDRTALTLQRFGLALSALRLTHAHRLNCAVVRLQQHARAVRAQQVVRAAEQAWHARRRSAALQLQRHARSRLSGTLYFRRWVHTRCTAVQSQLRAFTSAVLFREKQYAAYLKAEQSSRLLQRFMRGMQAALLAQDRQQATVDWLSTELEITLELQRERQEAERKRKQALRDKVRASMGARAEALSETELDAAAAQDVAQVSAHAEEIRELRAQLQRMQQENTDLQQRLSARPVAAIPEGGVSALPRTSSHEAELVRQVETLQEMLRCQQSTHDLQLVSLRQQLEASQLTEHSLKQQILTARYTVKRLKAHRAEREQLEKRVAQTEQRADRLEKHSKHLEAEVQRLESTVQLLRQLNSRYQEEKAEAVAKAQSAQRTAEAVTAELAALRQPAARLPFGRDGGAGGSSAQRSGSVRSMAAADRRVAAPPEGDSLTGREGMAALQRHGSQQRLLSVAPGALASHAPKGMDPTTATAFQPLPCTPTAVTAFVRSNSGLRSGSQQGETPLAFHRIASNQRSGSQQARPLDSTSPTRVHTPLYSPPAAAAGSPQSPPPGAPWSVAAPQAPGGQMFTGPLSPAAAYRTPLATLPRTEAPSVPGLGCKQPTPASPADLSLSPPMWAAPNAAQRSPSPLVDLSSLPAPTATTVGYGAARPLTAAQLGPITVGGGPPRVASYIMDDGTSRGPTPGGYPSTGPSAGQALAALAQYVPPGAGPGLPGGAAARSESPFPIQVGSPPPGFTVTVGGPPQPPAQPDTPLTYVLGAGRLGKGGARSRSGTPGAAGLGPGPAGSARPGDASGPPYRYPPDPTAQPPSLGVAPYDAPTWPTEGDPTTAMPGVSAPALAQWRSPGDPWQ